jgi:hypothetical protein
MIDSIEYNSDRRFGVELEFNAFDKLSRSQSVNNLPNGIYFFGNVIAECLKSDVEINKWHNTHNNKKWVLKPDSSCGIEVCSPPMFSEHGIKSLKKVINAYSKIPIIESDMRCSFHVHVEIEDFIYQDAIYMIQKWIQMEPFFFMLTNCNRWTNNYCKFLGLTCDFLCNSNEYTKSLYLDLSENKYFSINLCNYKKKKKKTVEFRIMGPQACLNSEDAANWVAICLSFVNSCKKENYKYLSFNDLDYMNIKEILNFISLKNNFKGMNIDNWIYSKLKKALESAGREEYRYKNYIWNKILNCYKQQIEDFGKKMEKKNVIL